MCFLQHLKQLLATYNDKKLVLLVKYTLSNLFTFKKCLYDRERLTVLLCNELGSV